MPLTDLWVQESDDTFVERLRSDEEVAPLYDQRPEVAVPNPAAVSSSELAETVEFRTRMGARKDVLLTRWLTVGKSYLNFFTGGGLGWIPFAVPGITFITNLSRTPY